MARAPNRSGPRCRRPALDAGRRGRDVGGGLPRAAARDFDPTARPRGGVRAQGDGPRRSPAGAGGGAGCRLRGPGRRGGAPAAQRARRRVDSAGFHPRGNRRRPAPHGRLFRRRGACLLPAAPRRSPRRRAGHRRGARVAHPVQRVHAERLGGDSRDPSGGSGERGVRRLLPHPRRRGAGGARVHHRRPCRLAARGDGQPYAGGASLARPPRRRAGADVPPQRRGPDGDWRGRRRALLRPGRGDAAPRLPAPGPALLPRGISPRPVARRCGHHPAARSAGARRPRSGGAAERRGHPARPGRRGARPLAGAGPARRPPRPGHPGADDGRAVRRPHDDGGSADARAGHPDGPRRPRGLGAPDGPRRGVAAGGCRGCWSALPPRCR